MDDADAPDVTDPNGTNDGLYVRNKLVADSKSVDMQGPIFHDLFDMDRRHSIIFDPASSPVYTTVGQFLC
ncbi:hypothetical protein MAR_014691 [Mya arenaria]|uniref:Uncharacterized protein n=1 Tax=Mya arenaria TaxID=6604 RepID=A0ABY7FGJ0_MYAAR|nr:hypothetical protein MAR_014691 [Mya arenaria]